MAILVHVAPFANTQKKKRTLRCAEHRSCGLVPWLRRVYAGGSLCVCVELLTCCCLYTLYSSSGSPEQTLLRLTNAGALRLDPVAGGT